MKVFDADKISPDTDRHVCVFCIDNFSANWFFGYYCHINQAWTIENYNGKFDEATIKLWCDLPEVSLILDMEEIV